MVSFFRKNFVIVLALIGLIVLLTLPSIFTFNSQLIGDTGDNNLLIVYHHIVANKLTHLANPFSYDTTLRYPIGVDFSRGFDTPLFAIMGGILRLFTSYIVAYNLALYISLLLNGVCSYILFRYLSKSRFLGILGAIMFGFSFYTLARGAGHVGLATTAGFPLFIYALLRFKEKPSIKIIVLCTISLFLISFATLQFPLFLFVLILFNIPILLLFYRKQILSYYNLGKQWRKELFAIFLGCFAVLFFCFYPYITALRNGNFMDGDRKIIATNNSVHLVEYIIPNSFSTTLAAQLTHSGMPITTENVVFIGWIELVIFAVYCFSRKQKYKLFVIYNVFLFFFLSLGNKSADFLVNLPYSYLFPYFPFYYIPEASRYIFFVSLFTTIGIVSYLSRFKKNKFMFVSIIIFIIAERFSFYYYQSSPLNSPYTHVVKSTNTQAVFDIPVSFDNGMYDTLAITYGKSIVSGYMHWSVDTPESQSLLSDPLIARFVCNQDFLDKAIIIDDVGIKKMEEMNRLLVSKLKKQNITTFVVHKNDRDDHAKFYFPECLGTRIQTSIFFPQLFMPDATTSTPKTINLFFPAIPYKEDTLVIPADGKLSITGFHVYPSNWKKIHILINGIEVSTLTEGKKALPLTYRLTRGELVTFRFDKNKSSHYSLVKVWYTYDAKTSPLNYTVNGVTKIYEDEDAAVFTTQ